MSEQDPHIGLTTLHHIDRVVEDKIKTAVATHSMENAPWRNDVDRKLCDLEKLIRSGFPDGDPPGHCRVHEQYIVDAKDRKETRRSLFHNVLNAIGLGAVILMGNALWEYVRGQLK